MGCGPSRKTPPSLPDAALHVADLRPLQHAAVARLEHGLGGLGRALTREQLVLRAGDLPRAQRDAAGEREHAHHEHDHRDGDFDEGESGFVSTDAHV